MSEPALYVEQFPTRTLALPVSHGHVLHVEEAGSRDGIAALVLHGGPGSGCSPLLRRFFDPSRYRVVCVDQRGAGKSRPRGSTDHNKTALLVDDMRLVRERLGIERWLVAGGSWGAALALTYATADAHAVSALLLRAVFLAREQDIDMFFAGQSFDWAGIGRAELPERRAIALAWWHHECSLSGLARQPDPPDGAALDTLVDRYLVQSHYLRHRCWLDSPPLLERCAALPRVPTLLLHGSDDRVCLPAAARELQQQLPHAQLHWAQGSGHDPTHPALVSAMVRALDGYAVNGTFGVAP